MGDSEKKIYYDIVSKCWIAFAKVRPAPEFSDCWWTSLIADFDAIREEYKNTDFEDFVGDLTMKLQDQQERRQKAWKNSTT